MCLHGRWLLNVRRPVDLDIPRCLEGGKWRQTDSSDVDDYPSTQQLPYRSDQSASLNPTISSSQAIVRTVDRYVSETSLVTIPSIQVNRCVCLNNPTEKSSQELTPKEKWVAEA
ncbi:hypothetical protein TNCV_800141 [Trichonephila clavipes]|nr:hypothetical protein TNCV_800141 [Trichonephila clavipes]